MGWGGVRELSPPLAGWEVEGDEKHNSHLLRVGKFKLQEMPNTLLNSRHFCLGVKLSSLLSECSSRKFIILKMPYTQTKNKYSKSAHNVICPV